jgi:hydroxyethylthiazole kinase-like uncharacterized protein yjeF
MMTLDRNWLGAHPLPMPGADTDKNTRGRVLVAGGSKTVPGGVLLTGEAAFRAGAGKVQLASVGMAAVGLGLRLPEAAVFDLPSDAKGELASGAGIALVDLIHDGDALAAGPGMAPAAGTTEIMKALLANPSNDGSLLLDAAMIPEARQFEKNVEPWAGRRVLTPHRGEMAALMECTEEAVSPELAQYAARRFGATIVLKGPETWIAGADGSMLYYEGGGPGLAVSGSGDVLAGIIVALLARGADPQQAAGWGVWAHGQAGRCLASKVGTLGFLASELLPFIPRLLDIENDA